MKRLLSLSVLLLILSTVHCGSIFDGIRNCRTIRCYNTCHRLGVGSVTLGSWSRKVCGHSCGTVQRYTRAECTASKQIPSNQAMCTASTFRHGSGSATARTVKQTRIFSAPIQLLTMSHQIPDYRYPHGQTWLQERKWSQRLDEAWSRQKHLLLQVWKPVLSRSSHRLCKWKVDLATDQPLGMTLINGIYIAFHRFKLSCFQIEKKSAAIMCRKNEEKNMSKVHMYLRNFE